MTELIVPEASSADPLLDAETLVDAVGALRRQMLRRVGRPFDRERLTHAEADLLRHVRRNPDLSVSQAATSLGLAPNTISTLVARLGKQGLLTRTTSAHDARKAQLRLTPAARRALDEWRTDREVAVRSAVATLDEQSKRTLAAALPVLDQITRALQDEEPGTSEPGPSGPSSIRDPFSETEQHV